MSEENKNVIEHPWGYELVWANTPNYCGKRFYFTTSGTKPPFFFNAETDKSMFVNSGSFKCRWIDTSSGQVFEQELTEGQVWDCPKLMPCSLQALHDGANITVVSEGNNEDEKIIIKAENF
jgi:hypothetical protein